MGLAGFLLGASTLGAQQKIAYVASDAIMDRLPEAKNARAKLTELQTGWMREIQRQESEIERSRKEIETNRLLWSQQEKRDADAKQADMEGKLAAYRQSKFGPRQDFERQQTDLMGPVIDRVSQAIADEAKAQKYDYVFDKSSRGLPMLFANPANDITWSVLKRMGVDPSDSAAAAVEPPAEVDPRAEEAARRRRSGRNEIRPEPIDPNKVLVPNSKTNPPTEPPMDPK